MLMCWHISNFYLYTPFPKNTSKIVLICMKKSQILSLGNLKISQTKLIGIKHTIIRVNLISAVLANLKV